MNKTLMAAIFFMAASAAAGCGGGGGGSAAPAAPLTKTAAKTAAQKGVQSAVRVSEAAQRDVEQVDSGWFNDAAGRAAARIAATVTETEDSITFTNETDPDSGCTLNGTILMTPASLTSVSVSGSTTTTDCDDANMNGTTTYSGSLTMTSPTSASVSMPITFQAQGLTYSISTTVSGVVNVDTGDFTPSGSMAFTLNGTDADGYTYVNLTLTQGASNSLTLSGTVKDAAGFSLTYANSTLNADGSGTLVFTTNNDVTAVLVLNADGSGTGTLTQTSLNEPLLVMSWTAGGEGTIVYSDDEEDSFSIAG